MVLIFICSWIWNSSSSLQIRPLVHLFLMARNDEFYGVASIRGGSQGLELSVTLGFWLLWVI